MDSTKKNLPEQLELQKKRLSEENLGSSLNSILGSEKMIDGTMLTMPDTEENQAKYPQVSSQGEGLGFPTLRLVVVMLLATGAIIDYGMAPNAGKETGEHAILRSIISCIHPKDVILADCYYPSFFCLAEFKARGN